MRPAARRRSRRVRNEVAAIVSIEVLRKYQEWEEREINRIIDERMADPAPGIPIEDIMRETPARGE
ncbi:hypothetical protein [Streptomyces roseus]|uniref:Uncharacterized protein n=1 Tax=Streptomyces roseus TaxID=66430 RepID=A0A0J6XSJ6_9ACTN|nr:hypothetical protein [Streptomyces roseus]KMO99140.1 hypothetical protein ACS04_04085 [Streptomyces roseus]